jgi:DNA mismatch repair protein MutL
VISADPSRPPIRVLRDDVAARIAAGEVVERPASVVKELIENSLDAGASRVEVRLEGGGLERIQVLDDGRGVPADQVDLAFARHGTSKLRSDADLDRLTTLGFRGEALPSIAAVADLTFQTRAEGEPVGLQLRLSGGRVVERQPIARQPGTSVSVEDLFLDLPARRRFLRARTAEAGLCIQVVSHLALTRPDVAFRLLSEHREVFATPGDGELRSAALAVRGPAVVRGAFELGPIELTDARGGAIGQLRALLGPTQEQRSTRAGLSLFVNGRWVQNRALAHAVEEAYRTHLRVGRHPVAIVSLDLPPEAVDVNVHPTKAEVRLLRESEIYAQLHRAVLDALPASQHLLFDDDADADQSPLGFSGEALRVLGQAGDTYIVAEGALGLYLVDQHAAHERVLLERLRSAPDQSACQQLLDPETLELPASSGLEPDEVAATLGQIGFEAEPFGERTVLVRALPAVLADRQALAGLAETLDALAEAPLAADWRERLALELACKTAVKAGDQLAPEEMLALLQQLGETRLHEHCAHGRPTSLLLSHSQLARQFGRT